MRGGLTGVTRTYGGAEVDTAPFEVLNARMKEFYSEEKENEDAMPQLSESKLSLINSHLIEGGAKAEDVKYYDINSLYASAGKMMKNTFICWRLSFSS